MIAVGQTAQDAVAGDLAEVRAEIAQLREQALAAEREASDALARIDPAHRVGAANAVHYLALRRHDLRGLQERLSALGLSSLGRMEYDVLLNLDTVLRVVDLALGRAGDASAGGAPADGGSSAGDEGALRENAARLFGGTPEDRSTRIMVTLPSEAADDPGIARGFAEAGMDVARINCAHDDADAWARMAAHVRAARAGIPVAMDLGGPKLRTGPLAEGPRVVKVKPERDERGRVVRPARVWLTLGDAGPGVPVDDAAWLRARRIGDEIAFTDARERKRRMRVVVVGPDRLLLEGDRTAYIESGGTLRAGAETTTVGALTPRTRALRIRVGDTVVLSRTLEPGRSDGDVHHVGCTLPEAVDAVRAGHRVVFDDGRIEGVVRGTGDGKATIEVTRAAPRGSNLRAEKGINLPDTDLPLSALTDDDLAALDTVVHVADLVELSFVRSAADVERLFDELDARGAAELGVVVKLETVRGFRALPQILMTLLRRPKVGVMIARGDLAVEAGFERLAEVQEEILWLCEAAHVPVIWATQVLDSLAANGVPTRAEVTDAAAGERAECVMLNKGPNIEGAIRALDDILGRMHGHVDKKRPLLRRLKSWYAEG